MTRRLPAPLVAAAFVAAVGAGVVACQSVEPTAPGAVPGAAASSVTVGPGLPAGRGPITRASLVDLSQRPDPPPVVEIRTALGTRVNERAGVVFQNVRVLDALSASELLATMVAFNEALGVRCSFCHTAGNWADDTPHHKQIARGMIRLTHSLNTLQLATTGADADARVTCYACHGGRARPALNPADTARRPAPRPGG